MSTEYVEILLVEDEPSDEELTLRALHHMKLANKIYVARDGREAVRIIQSHYATLKLVLLDLKLPALDGLEVLEIIKSDPKTKSIPVVALTSSSQEIDIMKSYKLGLNSYIVKPVDFSQFTDSIRQIGFYWLLLNKPPVVGC